MNAWRLGMVAVLLGIALLSLLVARRAGGRGWLLAALRRAGLYAAIGPGLAGLMVVAYLVVEKSADLLDPMALVVAVLIVIFAYPFGGLPAFWGGACMGLLRPVIPSALRVPIAALLCFIVTAAMIGIISKADEWKVMLNVGLLGAGAGLGSELLLMRFWKNQR